MSELVKKIGEIDVNNVLLELGHLIELRVGEGERKRQTSLQKTDDDNDEEGIGRANELKRPEQDYNIIRFPEAIYTNSIIDQYKMYRTRLMLLFSYTCYSWHQDYSPRIHIPLLSNSECFFVIDKEKIHTPADGSVYWVDTTKPHTFVNASKDNFIRTHIVGCI